jgi:hypothetical protein
MCQNECGVPTKVPTLIRNALRNTVLRASRLKSGCLSTCRRKTLRIRGSSTRASFTWEYRGRGAKRRFSPRMFQAWPGPSPGKSRRVQQPRHSSKGPTWGSLSTVSKSARGWLTVCGRSRPGGRLRCRERLESTGAVIKDGVNRLTLRSWADLLTRESHNHPHQQANHSIPRAHGC